MKSLNEQNNDKKLKEYNLHRFVHILAAFYLITTFQNHVNSLVLL